MFHCLYVPPTPCLYVPHNVPHCRFFDHSILTGKALKLILFDFPLILY